MSDELFQANIKLCKLIQGVNPEIAAYCTERFAVECHVNDETPAMALSMAKKTLNEMMGK